MLATKSTIHRASRVAVAVIMAVVIVAPAALIAMSAGASGIRASAATTTSYAPTESGQLSYACSAGMLSGSTCTTTATMNRSICLTLIGGAYGAAAGTCTYSYYAELVSGETCPKGGLLTPASQTSWAGTAVCVVTTTTKAVHSRR
jgi:hypothetical protein